MAAILAALAAAFLFLSVPVSAEEIVRGTVLSIELADESESLEADDADARLLAPTAEDLTRGAPVTRADIRAVADGRLPPVSVAGSPRTEPVTRPSTGGAPPAPSPTPPGPATSAFGPSTAATRGADSTPFMGGTGSTGRAVNTSDTGGTVSGGAGR